MINIYRFLRQFLQEFMGSVWNSLPQGKRSCSGELKDEDVIQLLLLSYSLPQIEDRMHE